MIPYATYKLIHYLGIFSLGVALSVALTRAATVSGPGSDPWQRRLGIIHGSALFLVLLGGFGMMSRLGISHSLIFPGWIWTKLTIWLAAGALIVVARRRLRWAPWALVGLPFLGALAGFMALMKPF